MKRFGEKATREAIANGAIIRAWDWYTLEAGYRVIIDGETAGYIVGDLFAKLHNDGTIVKDHWAHSYTDYKAAQEATEEADDAAAEFAAFLDSFPADYEEDLNIVPRDVIREIWTNASSDKRAVNNVHDYAETIRAEWAEESDRVHAATLAALAPVIAAEEAAPAAEEAPAKLTPYERVIAKNPDCPNAWRLPGYPGAVYTIEYTDARGGWWSVHFPSLREYQNQIETLRRQGATIEKTTKTEAGQVEEIPAETHQEQTDRENREHCKRIAEDLDAYTAGDMYKCPHCGNVHAWSEYEESAHENADGEAAYSCPWCEWEILDCDLEAVTLYDYFADCLDIEYRCGSEREYRSVRIMVACGGPNIYIDTATKNVELYWWTDRAHYPISYEAADAVDDWAREYWECL